MTSFNDGIEAAAKYLRDRRDENKEVGNEFQALMCEAQAQAVEVLKRPEPSDALPADVRRLVIAARKVAFEDQGPEALRELDKASEAFASRVPWENEPAQTQPSEAEKVERVAKALCETDGHYPYWDAPTSVICGPNNEVLPWWRAYEEQARAALAAAGGE